MLLKGYKTVTNDNGADKYFMGYKCCHNKLS